MPSKANFGVFIAGTGAVLALAWRLTDFTLKEGVVFFASMLIGGALYWSQK